jgi:hypothetical protein
MTETTTAENTTEERSCRLCGRPAGRVHYCDEDEGLCPAHNRVRRAAVVKETETEEESYGKRLWRRCDALEEVICRFFEDGSMYPSVRTAYLETLSEMKLGLDAEFAEFMQRHGIPG